MKRLIALILVGTLLIGCAPVEKPSDSNGGQQQVQETLPQFAGLDDTALLNYMKNSVQTDIVATLDSEKYVIEDVQATYLSKEYLEEVEFNSQENVYFGRTLSELDALFQGTRYVFTLGDDGQTTVKEFDNTYNDYYELIPRVMKNVATGAGVILLCVTISTVSAGAAVPAVTTFFAVSAKDAASLTLSRGVISGIGAGIVTGVETGNFEEALKAGLLEASESFKCEAIAVAKKGVK